MLSQGQFSPANTGEKDVFGFDFVNDLAGDTISSLQTLQFTVQTGSDAAVASRLIGAAQVSGTKVLQTIANLQPGVVYKLAIWINTGNGRILDLWNYLPCQPIGLP